MREDQILDSWNSEYMKNLRLKMIAGEEIVNCTKCVDAESRGLTSLRNTINKKKYLSSTNTDGSIEYNPTSLELHFGNTCNLHCKMCSQQYSHMIGKELLKMGEQDPAFLQWVKKESGVLNNWTGELDIAYDWYKNDRIKRSIFDHVSKNVQSLVVIGGEPTIIQEFYELLEYCHSNNTLRDKTLTITTNMTNTNKNLSTWLGSVKGFALHASIDGLGERNKYIRFPCNWNSVLKSMDFYKEIIKKYNNGRYSFAPAIQLLNIDQLSDLCKFFIENFASNSCSIAFISQVRYPIICDYAILPTEHRLKLADRLENSTKLIQHSSTVKHLLGHASDLRTESFTEAEKITYQRMFIRYNDQQDKFRKSSTWRALLPELETALTKSVG
jgi:MoaA/NifB/PqqE/SkfB family radical SAM enzyme